jgi:hypothetical protein
MVPSRVNALTELGFSGLSSKRSLAISSSKTVKGFCGQCSADAEPDALTRAHARGFENRRRESEFLWSALEDRARNLSA